jgi:ribose 5-phosphate isomerase A
VTLDAEQQKALAAGVAARMVQDGQIVGLGTGTTVAYLLAALAERVREGLRFVGLCTSERTESIARAAGITLSNLEHYPRLDLDIDGADQVDPHLNLLKGRGGALLREKIIANAARRFIVVVDESKLVHHLGEPPCLPVEIVPFGWSSTRTALENLGAEAEIRGGELTPFRTDNGNFILDCRFRTFAHPSQVAARIKALPGVIEHGFFLGLASVVLVGHADGTVSSMEAQP